MAIYEPNEFDKINDPEWVRIQRNADKLKKIRAKQRQDEEIKSEFGIPTSLELEQQFNYEPDKEGGNTTPEEPQP